MPLFTHVVQHPIANPLAISPLGEEQDVKVFLRWAGDVGIQVRVAVRYQGARAKGDASAASITISRDGEDPVVVGPEYLSTDEHNSLAFPARWVVCPSPLAFDADSEEELTITGEDVRIHAVTLFGIPPVEV